jgi:hypothetical protein
LRYNPPVGSLSNFVINGGMDVWQRGTSFISLGGAKYTADRWYCYRDGGASGGTFSRQDASNSDLPNIQYALRLQRDSGQTGTQPFVAMYNGETVNSIPYAGKTITISFYAKKGANYSSSSDLLSTTVATGTGTDQNQLAGYTGNSNIVNAQTVTLTTSWQRFAFTATVGSTAKELGFYFFYTPTGTASTNDWFEVTGVQIDVGTYTASTAPTFRRSGGTIQGELSACQRYYWRNTAGESLAAMSGAMGGSNTTEVDHAIVYPVQMRVRPTSLDYSTLATYDGVTTYTGGTYAIVGGRSGTLFASIRYTHTSAGLTAYRPYQIIANSSTTAYIGLSAEL